MKILVTGGAGYIGSHTCVELLNSGYDVIIVDNFSNSHPKVLNRIETITGKPFKFYHSDILNEKEMRFIFLNEQVDAVIHFAGLKAVGESVENPISYYHNNLMSTIVLLKLMKDFNVTNFVFSSSATVYGDQQTVPLKEKLPLQATNPYGRSKLMIEEMLGDVHISNPEMSIALLRYFNPIGAHESGLIGENPNGTPNNLVPYITQVAVGKLDYLKIFGADYSTLDGTGIRDYIHVVDLALGHIKALERNSQQNGIEAYNLGTGNGSSVLEMLNTFIQVIGRDIPYKIKDRRSGDIAVSYADPSKANQLLNWKASRDVLSMCEDSWRWQSMNPNGYEQSKNIEVSK
ncbi:UDP-glucose 4-epimerase GalE [Salipaludibacillus sp. HK11]|uniref:UDP-glucose 4-epimerase GalE n=1 Tax=Salipaludibacillus sp. HK11 TaxID=3394320 RepID=UPI0039FCF71D